MDIMPDSFINSTSSTPTTSAPTGTATNVRPSLTWQDLINLFVSGGAGNTGQQSPFSPLGNLQQNNNVPYYNLQSMPLQQPKQKQDDSAMYIDFFSKLFAS